MNGNNSIITDPSSILLAPTQESILLPLIQETAPLASIQEELAPVSKNESEPIPQIIDPLIILQQTAANANLVTISTTPTGGGTKKRRSKFDANGTQKPKTDLILPRPIVELPKEILINYCDNVNKRCLLCCEKYDTDRIYSVRRHLYRKHRGALEEEVSRAEQGAADAGLQALQGNLVNYVKSHSAFDVLLINLYSTVPIPISLTENDYFQVSK